MNELTTTTTTYPVLESSGIAVIDTNAQNAERAARAEKRAQRRAAYLQLAEDAQELYDLLVEDGADVDEALETVANLEQEQIDLALGLYDYTGNARESLERIQEGGACYVCENDFGGSVSSDNDSACESVGWGVCEQMGGVQELSRATLEAYFDFERFGRDLILEGYRDYFEGRDGNVYEIDA